MRKQSDIDVDFGRSVKHRRATVVFVTLAILLVVLAVQNLCIGSQNIPLDSLWAILGGQDADATGYQIIWSIRMPRLIAAALLGGALALAGFLLQTFFNNPIAGPFILGISSGAKLVVAIMMIVVVGGSGVMSNAMLIISAFVGSLIAMVFVLLVSRRINSMSMLIVAGVMIGYICTAATDFLITFASDANIVNLKNWSLGSFSGINWSDISIMTVVVLASSAAVFFLSKPISAFQLGEQYARSMGVNIRVFRIALILLSSLLAATVTAFAGPISFVGIAVPHVVKRMLGTSKPLVVIPGAFLGGAIFCLFCDLIARSAFAPTEVSISAVTAMFGAPIVISILLKREKARR
jgi:iron complex transport system permease protein